MLSRHCCSLGTRFGRIGGDARRYSRHIFPPDHASICLSICGLLNLTITPSKDLGVDLWTSSFPVLPHHQTIQISEFLCQVLVCFFFLLPLGQDPEFMNVCYRMRHLLCRKHSALASSFSCSRNALKPKTRHLPEVSTWGRTDAPHLSLTSWGIPTVSNT